MSARFGLIDFDEFHRVDLPARLEAGNGKLAAADLDGVKPLAFRLTDGRAYSYTPTPDGIEITATTCGNSLATLTGTGLAAGGVLVASEPLDDDPAWIDVPDGSVVRATTSGPAIEPLLET